jgi:hypothetical protein
MEDCNHEWLIVLVVDTAEWGELAHKKDEALITKYEVSHTLFCKHCQLIKQVK